jgi:hypothetical protein
MSDTSDLETEGVEIVRPAEWTLQPLKDKPEFEQYVLDDNWKISHTLEKLFDFSKGIITDELTANVENNWNVLVKPIETETGDIDKLPFGVFITNSSTEKSVIAVRLNIVCTEGCCKESTTFTRLADSFSTGIGKIIKDFDSEHWQFQIGVQIIYLDKTFEAKRRTLKRKFADIDLYLEKTIPFLEKTREHLELGKDLYKAGLETMQNPLNSKLSDFKKFFRDEFELKLDKDKHACPVCLENMETPLALGKCGHVVCNVCETKCGKKCPTCRQAYSTTLKIYL